MKNFELKIAVTVIICLALGLIFSCKKVDLREEKTSTNLSDIQAEVLPLPDLYIPLSETDWRGWEVFGIRSGYHLYAYNRNGVKVLNYPCPIANKGVDFVVPQSEIQNFELAIEVFQNGLPVYSTFYKSEYYLENTDTKNWVDESTLASYPGSLWISTDCADLYENYARVGEGKFAIVPIVNPNKKLVESDYSNNASSLFVNVTGSNVIQDPSAEADNKPKPATNFTAKYNGKNKTITLDWDCPYHEPIYVYHSFTLKKDGVVIADNLTESFYVENVSNNSKHIYEVTINVFGLGSSDPITTKN